MNGVNDEAERKKPFDLDAALSRVKEAVEPFSGVGGKCANLTLGLGCGQAQISVDVHVHRITNRWGYVRTGSPEQTRRALEAKWDKNHNPSPAHHVPRQGS